MSDSGYTTEKLLILQGLPGSGKSTLAKQIIAADPTWVRVNKDDIRRELESTGWQWSPKNENEVKRVRDMRISMALERGNSVVSDDCNFGKHPGHLKELGRKHGALVEVYAMSTPLDECIRRDSLREGKARVGEEVIRKMWCKYLAPDISTYKFEPYVMDPALDFCTICDLDGTLSLFDGLRSPYDAAKCANDICNTAVRNTLYALEDKGIQIIYLSGRSATFRPQTEEFLAKNSCPGFDFGGWPLYMRPAGDSRKDWVVKGELFDKYVRGKYNVRMVLDDRNQVVDFWRSIGLQCWQVAPGDF